MKKLHCSMGVALMFSVAASASHAAVSWTDWVDFTQAGSPAVFGSLDVNGTNVGVTYDGPFAFAQIGSGGDVNYWTNPATYQSATVSNAPPPSDLIALNTGGAKTITFSQAVKDPLIALTSWNGNTVDFGTPIELLSSGPGFWGNGTFVINAAGTGFFGSGEVHGVIRLPGTFTQITFTDTSENWHGFTIGVVGLADDGGGGTVPEPNVLALIALGLLGAASMRRRLR